MSRILFLILMCPFLMGSAAWAAPVIEEAAEVWQQNLEYPASLIEISEDVTPKLTVEYAKSSFKKGLCTNAVLLNTAGGITPRIVIDYASSSFKRDLSPILFPVENRRY